MRRPSLKAALFSSFRRPLARLASAVLTGAACTAHGGTIQWSLNGNGQWNNAANWSPAQVPGAADDVVIAVPGVTVTYSVTAQPVQSVTNSAILQISGGTLTINGPLQNDGTVNLGNATLVNAIVRGNGLNYTTTNSALTGVTVDAGATLRPTSSGRLTIRNGLVLNGRLWIGIGGAANQAFFQGAGPHVLSGTGEVAFRSGHSNNWLGPVLAGVGGPLTIEAGIRIHGWRGTVGTASYPLENRGVIEADSAVSDIAVAGTNWVNATGRIEGTVPGAKLRIAGSTTTANLGAFSVDPGGWIVLDGELDNSSQVFDLASRGPLELASGSRLIGGTLTGTASTAALYNGSTGGDGGGAALDGVTLSAPLVLAPVSGFGRLYITNGLVLDGTLRIGVGSSDNQVLFSGSAPQLLSGSGQVVFRSGNAGNRLGPSSFDGGPLTIDAGIEVHGWKGTVGTVGFGLENRGVIEADSVVSEIVIAGTNWVNSTGRIEGTVPGAKLRIAGNTSTANLGDFSADPNGWVVLDGTLDNTSQVFDLASRGPLEIANGGRLMRGTLTGTASTPAVYNGSTGGDGGGAALDGVTVAAPLVLSPVSGFGRLYITNGLVLNGTLRIGFGSIANQVYFDGGAAQVLAGNGEVQFVSGHLQNVIGPRPSIGSALTIGPDIRIRGMRGTVGTTGFPLVNQGTIVSDLASSAITVLGTTVSNSGTLHSMRRAGTLACSGPLTNSGLVRVDSAEVFALTGSYTQTAAGTAHFEIAGPLQSQCGMITATGRATFAGALRVDATNGFMATAGSGFDLMTYSALECPSLPCGFDALDLPPVTDQPGADREWHVRYHPRLRIEVRLATDVDDEPVPDAAPRESRLHGNHPNPFNPQTVISFDLPREEHVRLVVFDAHGRRVREIANERRGPGTLRFTWDGRDDAGRRCASGVYTYRLTAGPSTATKKMVLAK